MSNYGRGRGRGRSFSNRHSLPPRGRGNRFGPKYSQESNSLPSTSVTRSVMSIPAAYKISIDLEFDENTDMWYKSLRQIWNLWKKSQAVTNKLVEYFENVENPYIATLRVVYNSIEFKDAKPKTFPFVVMEEFQSWLNVTSQSKRNLLSLDVKHSAFNIISQQKNFQFIKLVSKIYEFEKDKKQFVDTIKYIIYQHKYREACQMAIVLHLYDTFSIEDFLIPLVLQDKLVLAEEFLAGSSTHQVTLTKYLDSLLNKKTSVLNNIDPLITRLEIPEIKYDKLHPKPMGKLITRLIKMFNLPSTIAPNLMQKRNEGTLQFLVHKRYVENSLGNESWSEMVREAVRDNIVLQCELVYAVHFHDVQEALRWALYFNLDRNSWPYNVRKLEENPEQMCFKNIAGSSNVDTDFWTEPDTGKQSTVPYLKFSLPNSSIILIDTVDKFVQFLNNGLKDISIVGIDSEWKPCFEVRQNELSLIQIATPTNVYILDIYRLSSEVPHLWKSLGVLLFNNSDILKLGFGLMTDMNMIRQSLPCLGNIYYNGPGYLDLSLLWKELLKIRSFTFPYKGENAFGTSLSTLVEFCLGAKLDKSEQFSNWENRPLRPAQVTYAALDAFCLIQIYNTLSNSAEMQNIPFEDICYKIMLDTKVKKKTKRQILEESASKTRIAVQPPSVNTSSVRVQSLKIICDTMIQGLVRLLRHCGIDAIELDNCRDHTECIKIARDENRMILTKGIIFNKLYQHVPQGHCYRIVSENLDEQLKEVLHYFNVVVTKEDIFSRCQTCNNNNYIKTNRKMMTELVSAWQRRQNITNPPPDLYEEDGQWEDATGFSSDEDDYDEGTKPPISHQDYKSHNEIDVNRCLTHRGAVIDMGSVPPGVIEQKDLFYICDMCGKVYWDGSHLDKVLSGCLQGIVS